MSTAIVIALLELAAGISILLIIGTWRRRQVPAASALLIMAVAIVVWLLAYALEIVVSDAEIKLLWAKVEYFGITIVPIAWLVFVSRYTGNERGWIGQRWIRSLMVVQSITILLVWTNERHYLIWQTVRLTAIDMPLTVTYGPWFPVHMVVSYGALLLGAGRLIQALIRFPQRYHGQLGALLVGMVAPWIGNAIYVARIGPFGSLDFTPVAFSITCLALGWCLFRVRLLDLVIGLIPVARDAVVEGMRDAILVIDTHGQIVDLNPAAQHLLGQPAQTVLGRRATEVLVGWPAAIVASNTDDDAWTEFCLPGPADRAVGQQVYEATSSLLRDRLGQPPGRLIVVRDITQRRRAAEALLASEERNRDLVENAHDVIFTTDAHGLFTSLNRAGERLLGYTRAELVGRPVTDLLAPEYRALATHIFRSDRLPGAVEAGHADQVDHGPEVDGAIAGRLVNSQSAGGDQAGLSSRSVVDELEFLTKAGERRILEISCRQIPGLGTTGGMQVIGRDIAERKELQAMLEHQALHDTLTGLPNRTLLHERLQQAIIGTRRTGGTLALMLLDLDRFKEINDTFGHQVGDGLLRQIGPRLQEQMRELDTVARLGGDEFAIVLPNADAAGAALVARRLLEAIDRPFAVDGRLFEVGVSLGIALCPDHGDDTATLLRRADIAMYVAKRTRVGQVLYTAEEDQHSPDRLSLISELRSAIQGEQLRLHFQPQVSLADRRLCRVEALVRWQHPQLGLLGPAHFVALAEQQGLSRPLDEWVLATALRACAEWSVINPSIGVAVNISAQQLNDPGWPATVACLLAQTSVAPARLTLEITESSLMVDPARAQAILTELRELGVRLAVDDFGTGYFSLSSLKRLPVDEIKVDRSFVLAMTVNDNDAAIVRSTIGLGHDLGLVVVAEGVEDRLTWEGLDELACDLVQGFYLSKPLPLAEMDAWFNGTVEALTQLPPSLRRH